jgi:hypothetical protein
MITIAIEWSEGLPAGVVKVTHGTLAGMRISRGTGTVEGTKFTAQSPCRLEVMIADEQVSYNAMPTMVTVRTSEHPFTLLLRDVSRDYPIWIPEYGVVVTEGDDPRAFAEIVEAVRRRGGHTELQRIAAEPEESFAAAAAAVRREYVPTWLGLSRDMRIFEIHFPPGEIAFACKPRFHYDPVNIPELEHNQPLTYQFAFGKGVGPVREIARRLEDGVLPILHADMTDDEVAYHATAFVSCEQSPLTSDALRGTHFLVADAHGCGNMQTEEQAAQTQALQPGEMVREEETILYLRMQAVNHGKVPRYAWLKLPQPAGLPMTYDGGCATISSSGRVCHVARLNGEPVAKGEFAVLLKPQETATLECFLTHQPIPRERAVALLEQSFADRHAECRALWQAKLAEGTQMHLPEPRIDEMVRAGLLHLDLVTFGLEPDGAVAPTIGIYCPIGSESAPIIQFMDSVGWHALAERALQYFLDKQHADGFMQNFANYMLETGPALWTMGEHYRYTRDEAWVRRIAPQLLRAVDYLRTWRARNQSEELRGRGYGLMDGKVADPEDPFFAFMLNGLAYLGMIRVAEMLESIAPSASRAVAQEAAMLCEDLRASIETNLAESPVVPLGDGRWCPTLSPWAGGRGPVGLFTDMEQWWTHGAFAARDSLIGPLYLILSEVLSPQEQISTWLLEYHAELMHTRNVAMSQPYYSPHPWAHLQRGEVKAFLKEYYSAMAGLADRETYTFWEHFYHASPHKTHEEAWFLMRTRWMLYRERGEGLHLLSAVPRAWLAQGRHIDILNAASYFGPFSLQVESDVDHGRITARVICATERKPLSITLRLPHPDGQQEGRVNIGVYDPSTETVTIPAFSGEAEIVLEFTGSST